MSIQKVKGWMINGFMPTDKKQERKWKGTILQETINKYTFLEGLNFGNQIVIYDVSENGAWRQLSVIVNSMKCEHYNNTKKTCDDLYNCCDCGGHDCGCGYCWSCNVCENCLNEE